MCMKAPMSHFTRDSRAAERGVECARVAQIRRPHVVHRSRCALSSAGIQ
jgi:hypothetical protein